MWARRLMPPASPIVGNPQKEPGRQTLVFPVMRATVKHVSPREVLTHVLNGVGLGVFLAISLIVANSTVLNTMVQSPYPRLAVLAFTGGVACFIAVGSAISGFILSALDKS